MNRSIYTRLALTGAAGVAVLAATLGGPAAQAAASPNPTDPDVVSAASSHRLTPEELAAKRANGQVREPSKVMGSRTATQADVDSGLAATTTSTIYLCSGKSNLISPESHVLNSGFYVEIA